MFLAERLKKSLRFRLWLGRKLFGQISSSGNVVRISLTRVIKGPCAYAEVDAMRFVAANTTIPIPKIFKVYQLSAEKCCIEMQHIWGSPLSAAWYDMSRKQKETAINTLDSFIRQMRDLCPPSNVISGLGSMNQGFSDKRIGNRQYGPFQTQDDFHSLLRCGRPCPDEDWPLPSAVQWCHSQRYALKLTHGDFVMHNIMARWGKITAIIDWECAGWLPEYWEYTKAHYAPRKEEYYTLLEAKIPRYDRELEAEKELWDRMPEPGYDFRYDPRL